MVLRHDRQSGAAVKPMPAGGMVAGFTAGDVGRALRRARTRQGLSIKDVSSRTGLPIVQLRAAETGSLDVPNQLSTLKTVRRYADFLGLPGDRFALALLEHWPTSAGPAGQGLVADATAVVHQRPGSIPTAPGGAPAIGAPSGSFGPPTATLPALGHEPSATTRSPAPVTALPAGAGRTTDGDGGGPHPIYAYQDTGVTPAVRAPDEGQVWRSPRRRSQAALRGLVWVVALAVLAALVALVVDLVRPSVFRSVGAGNPTATTVPAASSATTGATATTAPRVTPTTAVHKAVTPTTTVHRAAGHKTTGGRTAPKVTPTSPTTGSITVGSSPFVVKVAAVNGEAWVQVTSPVGATPVFAQVIDAGQSKTFTVSGSAAVEVGSSAARLSVSAKSKSVLATYAPPTAPYTLTFQASRG